MDELAEKEKEKTTKVTDTPKSPKKTDSGKTTKITEKATTLKVTNNRKTTKTTGGATTPKIAANTTKITDARVTKTSDKATRKDKKIAKKKK